MIQNKFIHYLTYNAFLNDLTAGKISPQSICFVKDKGLIYTHEKEYYTISVDDQTIQTLIETVEDINNNKLIANGQYDNEEKAIVFSDQNGNTLFSVDISSIAIDGMVDNVVVENGKLIIIFNTDAGKLPIEINITDIFDPSNYYSSAEIDSKLSQINSDLDSKLDKSEFLTFKSQTTEAINNRPTYDETYTKEVIDQKLHLKLDKTEFESYKSTIYTKAETYTKEEIDALIAAASKSFRVLEFYDIWTEPYEITYSSADVDADANKVYFHETGKQFVYAYDTQGLENLKLYANWRNADKWNDLSETPTIKPLDGVIYKSIKTDNSYVSNGQTLIDFVNLFDYYTKAEIDDELEFKADKENTYTKTEIDGKLNNKADSADSLSGYGIKDAYTKKEVDDKIVADGSVDILLFGGILTDSDIDVHEESYGGSVDVANIFWSTDVDCFVYKYLPSPATPETQPVYYTNFGGRDKYSDYDFQPYKGKLYQNINTEDYYYHLDSFLGLKLFEPKVSDMEKPVMWFNGIGMFTVQQMGISETGTWEDVVYDANSDAFVYKKVTSSEGVGTVTYYATWLNEGVYNDPTTQMPRKGVIFYNAANCRFYNESAQGTLNELNSAPTREEFENLKQTVANKEQSMTVKSVSTLEQTSVQLDANVYHEFRDIVGMLDVSLPTTGIEVGVKTCVLHLTTGSAPSIEFVFGSGSGNISYQDGFAIEANSEYEINCLWNGTRWFIAEMKIAASSSTNSNNE